MVAVLRGQAKERIKGLVWPISRRRALAGLMIVFGLSRLGLIPHIFPTVLPEPAWGAGLVGLGLALWDSRCCTVFGIVVSALSVGALVGFGLDVGPRNTTSVIAYWLAFIAFIETWSHA